MSPKKAPAPLPQTNYPRIYELFPRLAGKINEWSGFVDHAQDLGFNWIWTNPFNLTCRIPNDSGKVGSLYSMSNHDMLDAAFSTALLDDGSGQPRPIYYLERLVLSYLVNGGKADENGVELTGPTRWAQAKQEAFRLIDRFTGMEPPLCGEAYAKYLRGFAENEKNAKAWYDDIVGQDRAAIQNFTSHAHEKGMKVMADLVLNHVSLDHHWVVEEDHRLEGFYALIDEKKGAKFDQPHNQGSYFDWKVADGQTIRAHEVRVETTEGVFTYIETAEPANDTFHRQLLEVRYPDGVHYPVKFRRYVRQHDEGTGRGLESLMFYREPSGTRWDDVAQFNFDHPAVREFCMGTYEEPGFFRDLARSYLRQGFDGFRADAAYRIPGTMWDEIIDDSRRYAHEELGRSPEDEIAFLAEIVGGAGEDKSGHLDTGNKKWDWATSSMRWWWDEKEHVARAQAGGQKDWHTGVENDLINRIARHGAVDFAESHDTVRSATLYGSPEIAAKALARDYAIAALGSSNGLFMPMGYEFGLKEKLNVFEDTALKPWATQVAESGIDITSFIRQMNAVKKAIPVTPGISKEVIPNSQHGLDENIVLIRRQFRGEPGDPNAGSLIIAVNRDLSNPQHIKVEDVNRAIGRKSGEAWALCPGPNCPKVMEELWLDDKARIIWVPPLEEKKAKPSSSQLSPAETEARSVFEKARSSFLKLNMKFVRMGPPEKAEGMAM